MQEVKTPGKKSIDEVSSFFKVRPDKLIKTLFYLADSTPVCVLLRGDDNVNEVKLKNYLKAVEVMMLDDETIEKITKSSVGFAGPVDLCAIRIIADNNVKNIKNAVTGANKVDMHIINVNIDRDFVVKEWADIIEVKEGEICHKCKKAKLKITSGIELGHIFKLGQKYTTSMQANYLDQDGKEKVLTMGCYGIGVSRMVAAILEQHNDKDGIIWPKSIAPYDIHMIVLNTDDKEALKAADELYELLIKDFEVLFDDRDERPGFKFKDADLLGMPLRVVVSSKNLKENELEIKVRSTGEVINLKINKNTLNQDLENIWNNVKG